MVGSTAVVVVTVCCSDVDICSITVSVNSVVVVVSSKPPFRPTSVPVTVDVTSTDVTVPPLGPVPPTVYCWSYAKLE